MNSNYNGPSGMFESNGPIGGPSGQASMGNDGVPQRPKPPSQQSYGNPPPPPPPPDAKLPPLMDYQRPPYNLPGVLHFLQHEWTRFELDRAQWEVERAELQARVAFLQGERKSQESLKVDLVRRIKMLELALRQERAKFARFKSELDGVGGEAPPASDQQPPTTVVRPSLEDFEQDYLGLDDLGYGDCIRGNVAQSAAAVSGFSWKEGRHLLRQYLKEIGYTDTLINVRSARVRALLGTTERRARAASQEELNGGVTQGEGQSPSKSPQKEKNLPKSVMDNALMAAESALCATFDFLNPDMARGGSGGTGSVNEEEDSDEGDDDDDHEGGTGRGGRSFTGMFQRNRKSRQTMIATRPPPKSTSNEDMAQAATGEAETENALKEFDFLPSEEGGGGGEARSSDSDEAWSSSSSSIARMKEEFKNEQKDRRGILRPKRSQLQDMLSTLNKDEEITDLTESQIAHSFIHNNQMPANQSSFPPSESDTDGTLALGELAALTVNNDTEGSGGGYDMSAIRDGSLRKTWSTKYTLRSHFDGVRSLAFHPEDLMLMTASDDGTLKYWNLFRNWNGNKKASSVDFEPVHTFRGHDGPVLSCTMNANGECCISGGADSTIRVWNLSCTTGDPYEAYDPAIAGPILREHTDAVWHLKHHPTQPYMVSCSADSRLIWWNTEKMAPLTKLSVSDWGAPTSADTFPGDVARVAASFPHHAAVFDVETGKPVVNFKIPDNAADTVYRIIIHPSLPIAVTAHEDREIRFFDTNTGELLSSMVAHLDAVSALSLDSTGLYLVSGSHDSSLRFWSMDTKTCVQETTIHRKKFDESVYCVAFHPSKNYVASGAADGVCKVYA
ncbi:Striatin [Hypsibius exemplaris]|uniref:Striatin n=1 Tax=Hypsibius exemplaris TaxID=2072580 RepID=A0A1W0X952_HYPEX|nr:Striatin [Hypsibius exemplaris]